MVSNEVYQLPLNDDGSPDVAGQYVYIAPNTKDPVTIRFTIEGTSSICRHGSLWVNIPEQGQDFHRHQFREYPYVWPQCLSVQTQLTCPELPLTFFHGLGWCPTSPAT